MRIAIVNDVPIAVEALRRAIGQEPSYQLAWVAADGAEAVKRCSQDTPDLILMDLVMPVMDGVEATRLIMSQSPCPILIVTSTIETHSAEIFQALGAGALDVVQTPLFAGNGETCGFAALKFKINNIGRAGSQDDSYKRSVQDARKESTVPADAGNCLVGIGASSGGPAALATILSGLPRDFPASVIIVQHVDAQFVPSLGVWLNQTSAIHVRVARDGDKPQPNTALIAGTNDHLLFVNPHSLGYNPEPRDCFYRPSIDVFFQSVVRHWKGKAAGILLTGMGRDGAKGLRAMREAGSFTIAQSAASSVVYGMPKAAAELNAASRILPVNEIAKEVIHFATVSTRKFMGKVYE
jgi:two-component system response regulator WspF